MYIFLISSILFLNTFIYLTMYTTRYLSRLGMFNSYPARISIVFITESLGYIFIDIYNF